MTRIANSPYETRECWKILSRRKGRTIFLAEVATEDKVKRDLEMTEQDRRMMYWGYSFETFCSSVDGELSSHRDQVNTDEAWCPVFKTKIGHMSILFAAEVDCIKSDTKGTKNTIFI